MVFFSFFRRILARYPPLSSSSSSSSSSSGFRDESTKEPRPRVEAERNETRFSLIRSTSYPQCGTTRTYVGNTRIHAYTRVFALARARASSPRSRRSHPRTPFFFSSRFILRRRTGWSLSPSSFNSISPLDRLACCLTRTYPVSFLRLAPSPRARPTVSLSPSPFVLSRSNNLSTR